MAYYGQDEWDTGRRPRPQARNGFSTRDIRANQQFLDPSNLYGGTRLQRTRSQGSAPQPVINVFTDVNQEALQRGPSPAPSPPYMPIPYPVSTERSSSRRRRSRSSSREGRRRSRLADDILAEKMLRLEVENERLRSRSRGRSDFGLDRRSDFSDWELERSRAEAREREQRAAWEAQKLKEERDERERKLSNERREQQIRDEIRIKQIESDAKREAEEQAFRDRIADEAAKKAAKEKAAKKALRQELEDEEREAKEEQRRQWEEYERQQKAKADAEKKQWEEYERKRKEKEEKKKAEEKEHEEELEREMRKKLEKQGYSQAYIDHIIKGKDIKKEANRPSPSPQRSVYATSSTLAIDAWRPSQQPVYAKVHRDYLSVDTLTYYDIPYEVDRSDHNYIIILREMDKHETDVLFEHTKRLRAGKLLIEGSKKDPQYAWYRKRSRSRSTARKEVKKFGILEISK